MQMWKSLLLQWLNSSPSHLHREAVEAAPGRPARPKTHTAPKNPPDRLTPQTPRTAREPKREERGVRWAVGARRWMLWCCSLYWGAGAVGRRMAAAGPPGFAGSPHGRDCGRDDGLHHLAQLTCHASSWCYSASLLRTRHNRCFPPSQQPNQTNQTRADGQDCGRDDDVHAPCTEVKFTFRLPRLKLALS